MLNARLTTFYIEMSYIHIDKVLIKDSKMIIMWWNKYLTICSLFCIWKTKGLNDDTTRLAHVEETCLGFVYRLEEVKKLPNTWMYKIPLSLAIDNITIKP